MIDHRCPHARKVGEWRMTDRSDERPGEAWEVFLCTKLDRKGRPMCGYTVRQISRSNDERPPEDRD